jgi:mannose-1-phosphate guanylyltransferase
MTTPPSTYALPRAAPLAALASGTEVWGVVFAGGIGSRFWPLSSPSRPKPVLRLVGERPLVAETVLRLAPFIMPDRVLVVTARDIAQAVREALPETPAGNVLVEPRPLGTAAALAWALDTISRRGGSGAMVCALHADITAAFPGEFRIGLARAASLAIAERTIVTLGVAPTRPETAFGYAVPGSYLDPLCPPDRGGSCRIVRFVEKPRLDTVTELLSDGAYWHAGVVVGSARTLHDTLFECARELAPGRAALANGNLPQFAGMVESVSIERGLLERTRNLLMVPIDCEWDDVGTWPSLRRSRDLDDDGNGAIGEAMFVDSESNVVHSEDGAVILFGCQHLLVVRVPGLTFVTTLERAADLKPLLDALPDRLRPDTPTPYP